MAEIPSLVPLHCAFCLKHLPMDGAPTIFPCARCLTPYCSVDCRAKDKTEGCRLRWNEATLDEETGECVLPARTRHMDICGDIARVGLEQHYANVEEDALESFLDNHNDMPPTREPSPEPVWHSAKLYEWKQEYLAERIQSHGQYFAPEPSVKPLRNNASDCGGGLSLVSLWNNESVARASQARGGHLPMAVTSGSSPKNDELMNFQ